MTAVAAIAAAFLAALTAGQRSAVDKLVAATMAREHIAGITLAVARGGAIAYEHGYGKADIAKKIPATSDTVYPIGSITKQFTATCVMLLAQSGKLSIDDPLSKYIPDLPWGDRVTLRHLLDQESGIVDFRLGALDLTLPMDRGQILTRLKQTDLLFAPGSKYEYSNSNYYLLGLVIEKASGEAYPRYLKERLLAPLGLRSTYYNDAKAPIARLASGYTAAANGPQPAAAENADWSYAAGAVASTASDLARWDAAQEPGRLLNADSLRELFSPGVLDDGDPTDYAFGWVVVRHNGHREIWHNGEITGFHAMNATYPDDRTDVVVLTNTGGTFASDQLAVQVFDILHPLVPSPADRAATARAKEWLGRIARGDVDRTQLTDQMSTVLTDVAAASAGAQLRSYGALKTVDLVAVDEDASGRSYAYVVKFAKQTIHWVMGIDAKGKIASLYFHL